MGAFKSKGPVHFWAGSAVSADEISDIAAYNKAVGVIWALYALLFAAAGVLSFINVMAASIALGIVCTLGTGALILAYRRIYIKYRD
jgi:hypothetical protein